MSEFVEQLKQEGVFAKEVRTGGLAFHSYFMEGIAPMLLQALKKVGTWLGTWTSGCGNFTSLANQAPVCR